MQTVGRLEGEPLQRVSFTAWSYDPKFHALLQRIAVGPELCADGSQLYRLPPCSTLIEPPYDWPEGQRPVFMESTQHWIVVSDHRGETWFDRMGRAHVIERLGNPENWDMTRDPPGSRRT